MQLRQKIFIVLALITGIPMLVLLFGVAERMEHQIEERAETELHATLNKISEELNLILNNQKSITKGLAKVPAVKRLAAAVTSLANREIDGQTYRLRADELENFFLNYQHAVPSIQALRFIDASGKTLVKVKEGKPIEPTIGDETMGRLFISDQSNKRFFKYAMKNNASEITMSDFELGQVTPGADFCPAMVRYSALIHDEVGKLDGVLVVNIWGSRLDATMESALTGYSGRAYIVEIGDDKLRDGIYLYHPDTSRRFADQMNSDYRLSNEVGQTNWQKIKSGQSTGSLYLDTGRMLFYQKIAPFPDRKTQWLIVVDADREALLAQVNSMRQWIWFLLALLLFASLVVAIWASGRMAQPVHHLAEIIRRYADGEHDVSYTDKRQDEIGRAGKAFNYLKYSLEKAEAEKQEAEKIARQSEKLASVGQLAAGIGHEINNPLMNIMSLASLIEDTAKNDNNISHDIGLLKKEGERCARIVQGILNFARENKPCYEQFDMGKLITETVALLNHKAENADIVLTIDTATDIVIEGDPNQLQQVLVNVILNAIQASSQGGKINIKSWIENQQCYLEILDYGSGISNKHVMKIFDPFFTTKEEGEGTGLGLSVSYGIIKHHGGTINIENKKQAGVLVQIILPVQTPNKQEENQILEAVNVE
ncbi:MAG: sensor histidine kinase [Gammaproteobacteria bacterium]|nr:sensor histidine kinase [Gammaproteobacteria bacterium]